MCEESSSWIEETDRQPVGSTMEGKALCHKILLDVLWNVVASLTPQIQLSGK